MRSGSQLISSKSQLFRSSTQRAADENDNRKVLVFISDLGLEVVARLKERIDAHHDSIEEALRPRKTSQLKRLLENFIAESASA